MGPGEWHDPFDSDIWRRWGNVPPRPASCDLLDEDEAAALWAVTRVAGTDPDVEVDVCTIGAKTQAHISLPDGGSQTITRDTWRELLGKLTEAIRGVRLALLEACAAARALSPPGRAENGQAAAQEPCQRRWLRPPMSPPLARFRPLRLRAGTQARTRCPRPPSTGWHFNRQQRISRPGPDRVPARTPKPGGGRNT